MLQANDEIETARPVGLITSTLLMFAGMSALYTAPYQIQSFKTLGMTNAASGAIMTTNIFAFAFTSMLATIVVGRIDNRLLSGIGILIGVAGQAATAEASGFYQLALCRIFAGIGGGIVLATANQLVAAGPSPGKAFGRNYALLGGIAVVLLAILPHLIDIKQPRELFWALSVVTACIFAVLWKLPGRFSRLSHTETIESPSSEANIILSVGVVMFSSISGGSYVFNGLTATRIGVSDQQYGLLLSAYAFMGVAGSLLVGLIGFRFGHARSIGLGVIATAITLLGMLDSPEPFLLAISVCVYGFCFPGMISYLIGFAATSDRSGRNATMISGWSLLAYSIGPAIVGNASLLFGWAATGGIALIVCLTSSLVLIAATTPGFSLAKQLASNWKASR